MKFNVGYQSRYKDTDKCKDKTVKNWWLQVSECIIVTRIFGRERRKVEEEIFIVE